MASVLLAESISHGLFNHKLRSIGKMNEKAVVAMDAFCTV
jgi:hypothetical protein